MRTISIETLTHGRVLIKDAVVSSKLPTDCLSQLSSGYLGERRGEMLAELERIPGSEQWTLVSAQGLHRFYSRGGARRSWQVG